MRTSVSEKNKGRQYYACINTHGCKANGNTKNWKGWVDEGEPISKPPVGAMQGAIDGGVPLHLQNQIAEIHNWTKLIFAKLNNDAPPPSPAPAPVGTPQGAAPPHVADLMEQ